MLIVLIIYTGKAVVRQNIPKGKAVSPKHPASLMSSLMGRCLATSKSRKMGNTESIKEKGELVIQIHKLPEPGFNQV